VTCREFADFILDYLEGTLPADTRESFDGHLSLCANCDRYLAQYRITVESGRSVFAEPDAPLPGDVPEGLVRAILAARPR
jgi:anti-sigma factor RsiW